MNYYFIYIFLVQPFEDEDSFYVLRQLSYTHVGLYVFVYLLFL